MKLVFLVEELSMAEFLNGYLPRILPDNVEYQVLPHQGKSDLLASIPRKLRGWQESNVRFVVMIDNDLANCIDKKAGLRELCNLANRPDTLIRIVCQNLECWFLGDLLAIGKAFNIPEKKIHRDREKFRTPDTHNNSIELIEQLINTRYRKVHGARLLSNHVTISPNNSRSRSFQVFHQGIQSLIEQAGFKSITESIK